MACRAAALSAPRRLVPGSGLELAWAFAALALAAEQALLKIADLGLRQLELGTERRLALRGLFPCQRQFSVQRRLAVLGVRAQLRHKLLDAVLQLL